MEVNELIDDIQQNIRQTVIPYLTHEQVNTTSSHEEMKSMKSLKKDRNIIILPVDDGTSTVIMNRANYISKARSLLADTITFRKQNNDPTNTLIIEITRTLERLRDPGKQTRTERWTIKAVKIH